MLCYIGTYIRVSLHCWSKVYISGTKTGHCANRQIMVGNYKLERLRLCVKRVRNYNNRVNQPTSGIRSPLSVS